MLNAEPSREAQDSLGAQGKDNGTIWGKIREYVWKRAMVCMFVFSLL